MMQEQLKQQNIKSNLNINPRIIKYGLIYFSIVIGISLLFIAVAAHNVLSYDNIYQGVYIGDMAVGGEQKESITTTLNQKYQNGLEDKKLELLSKERKEKISYSDVGAFYDINNAVSQAYEVGRRGSSLKRLHEIYNAKRNKVIIPLKIQADTQKLEGKVAELASLVNIPVKQYSDKVDNDKLIIAPGVAGTTVNAEKAKTAILDAMNAGGNDPVEIDPELVQPNPIDIEEIYNRVCTEPADAHYEVKNYKLNVVPQIIGKKFDKEQATKIVSDENNKGPYVVPLTLSYPNLTKEALAKNLDATLFKDKLAQYVTSYNPKDAERSTNVILATQKINNIVLGPGDVFSYNQVVGSRTVAAGYQNAKVFVGGTIVDGLAGGICQVSSTLYNAVLKADLEIVSRTNHSLPVSYVPLGQDATVADGSIDFKFKNSTKAPIKIMSSIGGGRLSFEIYGTNADPGKTIEIENETIQSIPFNTKRVEDGNIQQGSTVVQQRGMNGCIVDTYKVVKRDGNVVERKKISRSNYTALDQVEAVGTKQVSVPANAQVPAIQQPSVTQNNESQQAQVVNPPVQADLPQTTPEEQQNTTDTPPASGEQ